MSNSEPKPADTNLLRSKQVTPLPIGSGGNNSTKNQMNQMNTQLHMMTAQATANTKYDPPVPQPITKQVIKETFISDSNTMSSTLLVIGGLLIVYGLVSK
jgi:hypothetical protein